jgi:hypothetical protein
VARLPPPRAAAGVVQDPPRRFARLPRAGPPRHVPQGTFRRGRRPPALRLGRVSRRGLDELRRRGVGLGGVFPKGPGDSPLGRPAPAWRVRLPGHRAVATGGVRAAVAGGTCVRGARALVRPRAGASGGRWKACVWNRTRPTNSPRNLAGSRAWFRAASCTRSRSPSTASARSSGRSLRGERVPRAPCERRSPTGGLRRTAKARRHAQPSAASRRSSSARLAWRSASCLRAPSSTAGGALLVKASLERL